MSAPYLHIQNQHLIAPDLPSSPTPTKGEREASAFSLVTQFTVIALLTCVIPSTQAAEASSPISWSKAEWQTIQSLSIDQLTPKQDKSNQYRNNPDATKLGEKLFFDQRLSKNGQIACATCHRPDNYFTDGQIIALGQTIGKRNTPSLHGVANNTWFFWDGRKDSLWSQALAPFENPAEHAFPRTRIAQLMLNDLEYNKLYQQAFGKPEITQSVTLPVEAQPSGSIEQIKAWKKMPIQQRQEVDGLFANIGKSIAAYISTLPPLRTRLDDYISDYAKGQKDNQHLNAQELAGLRLFIKPESQCINCHFGPLFTNQSFHNIGTGRAGKDSGRAAALDKVRFDRFNCMGEYSDLEAEKCLELRFMQRDRHALWGAFKTPTLRNISNTAPYFHDGRSKTLANVIQHYTDIKASETHLQALSFSEQEKADLLAFLNALAAKE